MDAAPTDVPAMDTVVSDPPAAVLAERQRLGLDRFDEVWDGEYHMVPGPSTEHQRIEIELAVALFPIIGTAGLRLLHEINLLVSESSGFGDFRIPDLAVYRPDQAVDAGLVGGVSLVVEIRSPSDESFAKLPFYERLGVGEVLIIDRDTKAIRRWVLTDGQFVESPGDPAGHHRLACIPVTLHAEAEAEAQHGAGGVLVVSTDDGVVRI